MIELLLFIICIGIIVIAYCAIEIMVNVEKILTSQIVNFSRLRKQFKGGDQ